MAQDAPSRRLAARVRTCPGESMRPSLPARALDSDLVEDRARALGMTPVSRETAARLDRFVDILLRWQQVVNLVASSSLSRLWTRHVADSLQLLPLSLGSRIWVDFGTGGGFPGLVLACALADVPGAAVHLIESNGKKAAFLREAARISGAAAIVHQRRIEAFVQSWDRPVDVVTARALAGLPELVELAEPLLKRGAQALFLKSQDVGDELTEVAKCWNIDATVLPSQTDPRGRIVHIRSARRRASAPPDGTDSQMGRSGVGMKRSRP